jgi:5S rRNA maturation endonuclease (ribonuclease M5)
MRVCRWEQPGGKDIRPLIKTVDGWKWGHHPNPRPLFQLDRLTNEPEKKVLLVEGEKTAMAAQKLFPDHIVTTWAGGAAATGQADISVLKGRDVTLIPDCDAPGRKAMAWMLYALKASAHCVRIVDPAQIVKDLPEKWDLADALAEKRDVSTWLAEAEQVPPAPRIVLRSALEIAETSVKIWWLLEPYLERNASILLFGDLGTLKSFLALHWALICSCMRHCVVYLSAEGKGLPRRIKGWARHRWGDAWQSELAKLPFFGIERPLNLSAALTVAELLVSMEAGAIEPALIIIDTLSKNSDGRIETSNEDAQIYLNQIDQELRSRFDATVLMVHHCGHAEKGRARGPYSLMANTDANYLIERPDLDKLVITVKAGRMKDTESPPPFSLQAKVVETGDVDDRGKPVTTLILEPSEEVAMSKPKRPTGKAQKAILSALEARQRDGTGIPVWTLDEIRQIAKELDIAKSSARDATRILIDSGFLKQQIGGLALGYQP